MKKQELDHVLRAAGRITGEKQFIVIGSQALHGTYPDLADHIVESAEVDLLAPSRPGRTEWLNAIGVYSQFHETFGYYADPVDETTATLPAGWKSRLVELTGGDTGGVKGLCLEPHDLAIAKYVASREKDLLFNAELARRGLLSEERLLSLLQRTALEDKVRDHIRAQIARDFAADRNRDSVREDHASQERSAASETSDDLDAIKARARQEWLQVRRQVGAESSTVRSSRGRRLQRDIGKSVDDDESQ